MIPNAAKVIPNAAKVLNSFSYRIITPSLRVKNTFERIKMTRQEYIFYKWSEHRRLRNAAWRDPKTFSGN